MPYPAERLITDGYLRSMKTPAALAVHMAIHVLGRDALAEELCQTTGLSAKTLTKCLTILEELGLVTIERNGGRNQYRLLVLPEPCGDGGASEPDAESGPPTRTALATTSRRGVFVSGDGHSCASELEARVDDRLHHLGIWHAREVPYATLISSWEGKHTVDFVLASGLAIEVAGHTSTEYRATLTDKVERAKAGKWRVLIVDSGNLYSVIDEQLALEVATRLSQHSLQVLQRLYRLAPDDLCSKRLLRPRIQTIQEVNARNLREAVVLHVLRDNKTVVNAYKLSQANGVAVPEYALLLRSALVDAATEAGCHEFALHIRGCRWLPDEFSTAFAALALPTGDALSAAERELASRHRAPPPPEVTADEPEVEVMADEPVVETGTPAPPSGAHQLRPPSGVLHAIRRALGLGRPDGS